jgi:outer membrane protein OmpA-like peptidoglycan-associated protein
MIAIHNRRRTAPRSAALGLLLVGALMLNAGCATTAESVRTGAIQGAIIGTALGCIIAVDTAHYDRPVVDAFGCAGGALAGTAIGAGIGYLIAPGAPPPSVSVPEKEKLMLTGGGPFSGRSGRATPSVRPKEKLALRGVRFDYNLAALRPEDEPLLDEAADTLQAHPTVAVYVDGYCDGVGKEAYNQKLSERRAQAVVDYLESKGIDSARLIPRGFGSAKPVASNATDDGRAQNRRVELIPIAAKIPST